MGTDSLPKIEIASFEDRACPLLKIGSPSENGLVVEWFPTWEHSFLSGVNGIDFAVSRHLVELGGSKPSADIVVHTFCLCSGLRPRDPSLRRGAGSGSQFAFLDPHWLYLGPRPPRWHPAPRTPAPAERGTSSLPNSPVNFLARCGEFCGEFLGDFLVSARRFFR